MKSTSIGGLTLFTAFLAGCPGSLDDPDRFGAGGGTGCPDIETEFFPQSCTTAGCHNATDNASGLNLEASGLADRIVDVEGDNCGVLVDTASPENSSIYTKTLESNSCDARMPLVGTSLTPEEEQCLLDWLSTL